MEATAEKKQNRELVMIRRKNKKTGQMTEKEYETVASRLNRFIDDNKHYDLINEAKPIEGGCLVICNITVFNGSRENVVRKARGHAFEKINSNYINETSHVENAETSAVGRCLAFLGYGGHEIASADELANAIVQHSDMDQNRQNGQHNRPPQRQQNSYEQQATNARNRREQGRPPQQRPPQQHRQNNGHRSNKPQYRRGDRLPMNVKYMQAQKPGRCMLSQQPIQPGDKIVWSSKSGLLALEDSYNDHLEQQRAGEQYERQNQPRQQYPQQQPPQQEQIEGDLTVDYIE